MSESKINWKKGLRRVWFVFAVIWWIGCVISFFYQLYKGKLYNPEGFAGVNWVNFFEWLIGPLFPFLIIILFFIGKAALNLIEWIIEGFKEEKPQILEDKEK